MITKRFLHGEFNQLFDITRWASYHTFQKENLATHQFAVAVLANSIAVDLEFTDKARLQVLVYSLHHDWDEIFTGDIGHEVKYNSKHGINLRQTLNDIVDDVAAKHFLEKNTESELEIGNVISGQHEYYPCVQKLSKVCDWLSMLWFCAREIKLGNRYFEERTAYCANSTLKAMDAFWDQLRIDAQEHDVINALEPDELVLQALHDCVREVMDQLGFAIKIAVK